MARPSVIEKLNNARVLSAAIKELRADVETIRDDAEARQWLDALAAARQVCGDDIDLSATEFVEVVDAFNCHYYSRKGDMMPLERVLAKSRAFKTMEVHFMGNGTPRVCSKSWADKLGNFAFSEWNTDPSKTSNTDKDEILAFEKFPVFEEISALDQNCGPPVIKELNLRIWRAELNKSEEKQQKRPTPFSMKAKREIRTLREDFPEIRSDREASKWLTALGAMRQCYGALWTLSRKTFVQIIQCFQKTIDASACATPMPLEYLLAISNVCVQSLGRTEFTQEASNLMNIAAHTWKTGLDGAEIQEGMDKACLFFLHNQLLRRGAYMYGDNGPPLVGKNKFQRWKSGDRKKELESLKWRWNTESSEDRIETEEEKCLGMNVHLFLGKRLIMNRTQRAVLSCISTAFQYNYQVLLG